MLYVPHPVYEDPGSNHWIGNQVWALQRLAELYYYVKTDGDQAGVKLSNGMTIEAALEQILDKWVTWAVSDGVILLHEDGTFEIPATLDWSGEPDKWTGTPSSNTGLTATITNWGSGDLGCAASFADIFIYYAKAKGIDWTAAVEQTDTSVAGKALYTATQLMDRMWQLGRDDIGLAIDDTNANFKRLFEQDVYVPVDYGTGKMPNGDEIKNGIKFLDIRSQYKNDPRFAELKADYDADGETKDTVFRYHRFWHAGDILITLGAMADLYPEATPDYTGKTPEDTTTSATETTPSDTTSATETSPSETDEPISSSSNTGDPSKILWGDVTVDGVVDIRDITLMNQYIVKMKTISDQGLLNGDVYPDSVVEIKDLGLLKQYIVKLISSLDPKDNGLA